MKYFINRKIGVMFREAIEIKKDEYTAVDIVENNVYTAEQEDKLLGTFTYDGVLEFLEKNKDNVIVTQYHAGDVYKCGAIITGEKPVLKLYTYAYNCMDLISLYNKYIDLGASEGDEAKAYYDITYMVDDIEFKARFEDINDLGIMLDEIEDENIIKVDMNRGNRIIASMKYFDDRDDIFTLELFGKYEEASEFIDLFEEYLR